MTPEQREAVRSNAKYLRNVRPVDPEEIHEYVEGRPHPAVVRQVLREDAYALGLVERDDGTFVPAPEGPVDRGVDRIERLPDAYAARLEDLLAERYGTAWHEGDSGDLLRETIRRTKEDYYRGRAVEYDRDAALGYAVYHLPGYYAAVQYVLSDLTERGLLGRPLRALDVGAGVGGPALGLHDVLPGGTLVDYHAVEPSAAAGVLSALLGETGRNFRVTIHRETAEEFDPGGTYDLVLFANVLSELDDPVAVVRRLAGFLAGDGSVVALAPADLETSTGLRGVERAVEDGLTVYGPAVRLWPGEAPENRGWSFDAKPDLAVPGFQRRLDDAGGGTGEFVNVDVRYSYSILRPDGEQRIAFVGDGERFARMADTERHVTGRIDLAAVKQSHDLSEGDNPVFLIGDGSQRVDHYAVLTRETTLNDDLRTAGYGDLLLFENVLVLWNDDEGAYNLVVDGETVVDRAAP